MTNLEIAELLRDVAAAYELKGAEKHKFQIIAYERAADAVEHATSELKDLWEEGKLDDVPGIGKSIAEHLGEVFKKGKSKHFQDLMKDIPTTVFELMKVPGIGVKTAVKLVKELKIKNLSDLKKAAVANKIAQLEGFGGESQARIIRSLEDFEKKAPSRMLLPYADEIATELIDWIRKSKDVKRVDPLGSLRRRVSTVGDIDLSAYSDNPQSVIEHFAKYPKATRVLEKGERSASIILPGNIQVDLIVAQNAYGALLQHFTGSKHHNVALREHAIRNGLSLSDYGIKKRGETKYRDIKTEEEFYKFLKMDYIQPELREDTGEIKAALDHDLPKLVELKDIKGDLHIHSNFDIETSHDLGLSSIEELVKKAKSLNYDYIALSEHNPSRSKHSEKEIVDLLKRKQEAVKKFEYKNSKRGIKVFNSLEIDIMPDGRLPVPKEGLETLDFAVVSVHSSFSLSKTEMTKRVLLAFDNPNVKIFAHPTARKLNEREGIDLDWPKIFDACIKKNIWLEINSDPMRLDLPDNLVHEAIMKGVTLVISTDSHHKDSMDNMKWGVSVARRGWCESKNVANTRSTSDILKLLI